VNREISDANPPILQHDGTTKSWSTEPDDEKKLQEQQIIARANNSGLKTLHKWKEWWMSMPFLPQNPPSPTLVEERQNRCKWIHQAQVVIQTKCVKQPYPQQK
jgi:hypothetical protein